MNKYLIVVNHYTEFAPIDCILYEWEHDSDYENGKNVFYIVEAETMNEARYRLIRILIPTWDEEFAEDTLWHLNDCISDKYEHMDQQFLKEVFTDVVNVTTTTGKIKTIEEFHNLFTNDTLLALYQDLMLSTYHAYEYSEL